MLFETRLGTLALGLLTAAVIGGCAEDDVPARPGGGGGAGSGAIESSEKSLAWLRYGSPLRYEPTQPALPSLSNRIEPNHCK